MAEAGTPMPEDLQARLQSMLTALPPTPVAAEGSVAGAVAGAVAGSAEASAVQADTARGWLDLAYEAAAADDTARAGLAARNGLDAPGGQDPLNRAALLRALATITQMTGDREATTAYIAERAQALRAAGYPHQAQMEVDLGEMLLREPEEFEAVVLEGVAEAERGQSAQSLDSVLPDVLAALAVRRIEEGGFEAAVTLLEEALDILGSRAAAGVPVPDEALASTRMLLAHVHLMDHEPARSAEVADTVLAGRSNRAVRAAMWMLKSVVAQEDGDRGTATAHALRSLELHAAAGVRKGAASAAALIAGMADDAGDHQSSILAWKVAVAQAEKGEVPEASDLTLALGHQLLEAEEHELAERVLDGLVRREEAAHRIPGLARALVDLGHAARYQDRPEEALRHWDRAAGLFEEAGSTDAAARMHLAAGALLNRQERPVDAAERFTRAVALARGDAAADGDGDAGDGAAGDGWDLGSGPAATGPDADADGEAQSAAGASDPHGLTGTAGAEPDRSAGGPGGPGGRRGPGDPRGRRSEVLPQALHALGHVLCELGDERGVGLLDEAIALAKDSAASWYEADFTDTRARGLWALRKGPAAVSSALNAADLFAASQDSTASSNAELFAAYVLLEQERAEESATLFRMITEQEGTARHLRMAAWLGLAQSLDLAGDEEGATVARQQADAAAHEEDPAGP